MRKTLAAGFGLALSSAAMVSGCSNTQVAIQSPASQRAAIRDVTEYEFMPVGGIPIQSVNAATCSLGIGADADAGHIVNGLKIKASQLGANGITHVKILILDTMARDHCEYGGVGGTAQAFSY